MNAGRGILGGLSNAVSGAIFGNVPFKNAGQAFGKGALAGAATSGLGYLSDLIGKQPKSVQMRHFPGGAVARTPYERLMDPRGICILQDIFGSGLGIRKAYGYRYEMRDPDQPVRDGFDLGDFLRSTLTGGLMGGLSGVAFFGVGKAVGALKGSLSGNGNGYVAKPNHGQGFSINGYNPQYEERTFEGYISKAVSQDAELSLYTNSDGFNNVGDIGGEFKRFGTISGRHGIDGVHVHQPIRNVNLLTGEIRGGTFNPKKGIGVDSPNKLDIKQLYQFLFNEKYHR